jgi:ribonuclease P protein component
MTPKKNRVDKKGIEKIFKAKSPTQKRGSVIYSKNFSFRFIRDDENNTTRISFIVPKTVSKKAVDRNSLRRRGYRVLESYLGQFPTNILGVFVFKRPQDSIIEIENDIKNILHKIN